jgi:NADPH-dependent 2,4-dienoyl-CoA reductase/sulfur reductase-like enzyme
VAYLRTIEDSDRLKRALSEKGRLVIVGGGWIGLEVAAAARMADCTVTVLESLELPLLRVLGPEVARIFAAVHTEHGVDLRTSATVEGIEKDGEHAVVRLGDGAAVEADLIVVGVGVAPNTRLAEEAGIETDNGIVVDAALRSSDPAVYAAGDVANAAHPALGRHVRVEHWDTAIEQGKAAGRSMAGEAVSYDRQPYFFTDQYDLGMEYVGHVGPDGYDDVVLRGDVDGRVFTAFWLQAGTILAGMQVNDWDATDGIRSLLGQHVDAERLRDASVAWSDLTGGSEG